MWFSVTLIHWALALYSVFLGFSSQQRRSLLASENARAKVVLDCAVHLLAFISLWCYRTMSWDFLLHLSWCFSATLRIFPNFQDLFFNHHFHHYGNSFWDVFSVQECCFQPKPIGFPSPSSHSAEAKCMISLLTRASVSCLLFCPIIYKFRTRQHLLYLAVSRLMLGSAKVHFQALTCRQMYTQLSVDC